MQRVFCIPEPDRGGGARRKGAGAVYPPSEQHRPGRAYCKRQLCGLVGGPRPRHSLSQLRAHGFAGLQFNAVVSTNKVAIALYEKLGFTKVGTIPGGFRLPDDSFTDIFIYFHPAPEPEKKK